MTIESVDPTRIDIEFDPQHQRMSGRATHGWTKFDVPFMSEIAPNLWQGGCRDGLILPTFIDNLLSLYQWESYTVTHGLKNTKTVEMYDSTEQGFEQVDELARLVNEWRKTGPTLVHCQAGLNRSSLVATRALILDGMPAEEAVALVRERRSNACLCNPAFERWLLHGDGSRVDA